MPRDTNPLASSTLLTWLLSGIILIVAAYFVFYSAGVKTESLSHFGSFFGGVATGIGVLFAGPGFYLQRQNIIFENSLRAEMDTVSWLSKKLNDNLSLLGKINEDADDIQIKVVTLEGISLEAAVTTICAYSEVMKKITENQYTSDIESTRSRADHAQLLAQNRSIQSKLKAAKSRIETLITTLLYKLDKDQTSRIKKAQVDLDSIKVTF